MKHALLPLLIMIHTPLMAQSTSRGPSFIFGIQPFASIDATCFSNYKYVSYYREGTVWEGLDFFEVHKYNSPSFNWGILLCADMAEPHGAIELRAGPFINYTSYNIGNSSTPCREIYYGFTASIGYRYQISSRYSVGARLGSSTRILASYTFDTISYSIKNFLNLSPLFYVACDAALWVTERSCISVQLSPMWIESENVLLTAQLSYTYHFN